MCSYKYFMITQLILETSLWSGHDYYPYLTDKEWGTEKITVQNHKPSKWDCQDLNLRCLALESMLLTPTFPVSEWRRFFKTVIVKLFNMF